MFRAIVIATQKQLFQKSASNLNFRYAATNTGFTRLIWDVPLGQSPIFSHYDFKNNPTQVEIRLIESLHSS